MQRNYVNDNADNEEDELRKSVKFDLSSGKNVKLANKNFISILKSTSDASFENVLEVKSLLGANTKNNKIKKSDCELKTQNVDYSFTIQKFLENFGKITNDSGSGSLKDQSFEANNNDLLYKRPKIDEAEMFLSSTPIKCKGGGGYKLNLLTPPLDATFIDADYDFESMDQDQYDDDICSSKESLKKQENNSEDKIVVENKTRKQSTFAFIEETLMKTPLAIRKRFQRRQSEQPSKNPNFLNIFGSSRKKSVHVTIAEHKTIRRSLNCDYSSPESSRSTSPVLTEENLKRLENIIKEVDTSTSTLIWGENFEYSYECEPSNSDSEDEECTRLENLRQSPEKSFEVLKSPLVPTFKLQAPEIACEVVSQIITSSFAIKTSPGSFLKRSASDPMNIHQNSSRVCRRSIDRTITISESIEENNDFSSAIVLPPQSIIQTASVRSLDQIVDSSVKQIQNASPFRRWGQSSLRRENYCNTMRRPTSLVGSENDVYAKSMEEEFIAVKKLSIMSNKDVSKLPTAVITWGTSFEKLLDDSAGLCAFSEFLRKEFATENIYFWTACERYRRMQNDQERSKEAQEIFAKHMGVGALEPVNVDSKARILAQENLSSADPDLFAAAQKQIFNLMKFDSYQRFIKSDLYKSCLEAEAKNLPLPFSAEKLDPILRTTISTINSSKLKKSLSNAEDRRRKSLLPWHRKTRCKSKDRSDENNSGRKESTSSKSSTLKLPSTNSVSDVHSSRSSLSSLHYDPEDNRSLLCRVILSNGATTVAQTRSNETIHELVERLLEKRGIVYNAYEAFINGSSKPLDINGLSTSLSGKEVLIEQRVVFKLDLPNRKVISVKSKASKALGDVLRPILHKYNYQLDFVQTFVKDNNSDYPLDIGLPVTCIDGQRIFIVCREDDNEDWQTQPSPIIATSQHQEIINHFQVQAIGNNKTSLGNHQQQNTLDEITNKVFNELLQGKVDSSTSAKSEDYGSETSSGIFGRLRRRDANAPAATRKDNLANIPSTTTNDDGIKKPLIAKWKAGVKLQVTTRHQKSNDLLEGLTRAQRRLEDQRGTEINFELPDFLKNKENFTNQSAKLRIPAKRNELLSNEYDAQQAHNREKEHEKPQPAPRLSITKNLSPSQLNRDADLSNLSMKCLASPVKSDENEYTDSDHTPPLNNSYNSSSLSIPSDDCCQKAPPPLPPKPRIVPIKPSNWNSKPYLSNTSSFV